MHVDTIFLLLVVSSMEFRLVLNNRTNIDITNDDMCGIYHQRLKYFKFRRVTTKTGKSIFYLFFEKKKIHMLLFEQLSLLKEYHLSDTARRIILVASYHSDHFHQII